MFTISYYNSGHPEFYGLRAKSLDLVVFPVNTTDFTEMYPYRMIEVRRVLDYAAEPSKRLRRGREKIRSARSLHTVAEKYSRISICMNQSDKKYQIIVYISNLNHASHLRVSRRNETRTSSRYAYH